MNFVLCEINATSEEKAENDYIPGGNGAVRVEFADKFHKLLLTDNFLIANIAARCFC